MAELKIDVQDLHKSYGDNEVLKGITTQFHEGDVVCIIEAMKMMNEIKSEVAGKVVEVCVEDGQPVEFGQVLMYVE